MALPQLSVKQFEVRQPSTGEKLTLRPFLVSEEKILLQAGEQPDTMMDAMKQVLKNCIIGQEIDLESLPAFDIEFLFLQLRSESIGAQVPLMLQHTDKCERTEVTINLREIKVVMPENSDNEFMLDDRVGIKMKYPTLSIMGEFANYNEETDNAAEMSFAMIKKCIDTIFTKDGEVHEASKASDEELTTFVDSMNTDQFQKLQKFFDEMPTVKHTIKVPRCTTCGAPFEQEVQGIQSFF